MIAQAFFIVMAHQVKPRLTQTDRATGLPKSTHVLSRQPAYSIRASSPRAASIGRMYGCNLDLCVARSIGKALGKVGASMYGSAHSPAQPTIRETDLFTNSITGLARLPESGHHV
jgi:hypothetical protein